VPCSAVGLVSGTGVLEYNCSLRTHAVSAMQLKVERYYQVQYVLRVSLVHSSK
jgi:hypothetical protein